MPQVERIVETVMRKDFMERRRTRYRTEV
jgi:hypothetical protein